MPDHADPILALSDLAYQRASSALAEQQRFLDGLRNRAGTLLTAAAISTSFLGGQALASASRLLALADHMRLAYEKNVPHIARVAGYLRVGTIFLTFEVIWWVADLATRT